ncbi:integrase catalytic domain-containing protein [Trichonephila clavipes]|nr:integrase catalytic domain-containing protein [Trichonephila clavipes]
MVGRLVGKVGSHYQGTIETFSRKKSILTYEELSTVNCDSELLINSRLLTCISENPQELIPLIPAMFLIDNLCSDTTDIDELNSRDLRMRYRIKLLRDLRQRFRKE